jgi:hypothetical protein
MVPEVIKQSRWKRVDETILTANGLVLLDFFARAVAMRKAKETKMMIKSLSDFTAWANRDIHRLCACSKLNFFWCPCGWYASAHMHASAST